MSKYLKLFDLISEYQAYISDISNMILPNVSVCKETDTMVHYQPLVMINPSVTMTDWTYGETASNPVVNGNIGNGEVTYMYKVSTADDSTYTTTKPSDAGTYTIKATIEATEQYSYGTCTSIFTIAKANINPSVTMTDWTYGETASNPVISGNLGNGNVTYMYKVSTADDSTYTSIVPSTEGTYTIKATIEATSNYNGATCTSTFTINSKANPLIAKYNVTNTSSPVTLYYQKSGSDEVTPMFSSMEVDGVEQEVTNSYTFDTIGEHTVLFTLPEGETSISERVFYDCNELTNVIIPNSVTSIGTQAFSSCSGLTSITIPDSVTSIGDYAFDVCSSLAKVIISDIESWCNISFGNSFANPLTYAHHLYSDENTEITNLIIPNTVTSIGNYAFYRCSELTSVTIPDSMTLIGNSTFSGCSGLTKVIISDIESWSNISFGGADATIPECIDANPLTYAHHLYSDENTEITNLIIPNTVTLISNYAFYSCSGLTSVTIPDSVTSIGSQSFNDCSGLTSVTMGNSVTSIGYKTFSGCSGLTSVTISNSVTYIGTEAFNGCSSLTKVIISDIGSWCGIDFSGYYSNPLYYAHHLYSDENTEITNLIIPNTVTSIGDDVFYNCSGLTSVTIGNPVTSIGDSAFSGCSGLTNVTIGNSVTSIGDSAFSGCSGLTSITIGNSVKLIDMWTFRGCSSLASITIPDSVTSISYYAFKDCSSLTSVTIGNSVTSIYNEAFSGCSKLTSITIPDSVTSIGNKAFENCSSLTSITCNATTAPTISSYTFHNVHNYGTLITPSNSTGYNTWMSTSSYYLGYYKWYNAKGTFGNTEPTLQWSSSSYTITSDYYSTPTLSKSSGISVTYQSTNTSVATISSSGVVTKGSNGSTTIKAIFAGNSTYKPKIAVYDLTVNIYTGGSSGGGGSKE